MCLLKLNSSLTRVEYVTIATRVLAGKMGKYSIKLATNCFSKLKFPKPMLPDLSITKTMSILDEAIERKAIVLGDQMWLLDIVTRILLPLTILSNIRRNGLRISSS